LGGQGNGWAQEIAIATNCHLPNFPRMKAVANDKKPNSHNLLPPSQIVILPNFPRNQMNPSPPPAPYFPKQFWDLFLFICFFLVFCFF